MTAHPSTRLAAALLIAMCAPAQEPWVEQTTTQNGLRIWHFPSDASSFAIVALVGVGSRAEDPDRAGIAHVLEHCLLSAPRESTGQPWERELRGMSIHDNGRTTREYTAYHAQGPTGHWRGIVKWAAEILTRPPTDPRVLDKERRIVLEELAEGSPDAWDDPSRKYITLSEVLYPDHPLGRSIIGTRQTIRAIDRDDLVDFYDEHYRAGNTVIAFTGDVPAQEVVAELGTAFAEYPRGTGPAIGAEPRPFTGWRRLRTPSSGSPRTAFVASGYHVRDRTPADLAALLILERIFSNAVFDEVRERHQLAYSPSARTQLYRDSWRLDFEVQLSDHRRVEQVVDILDDVVSTPIGPATLIHAQTEVLAALHPRSARQLLETTVHAWTIAAASRSVPDLGIQVADHDPESVNAFARRHMVPENRFVFTDGGEGMGTSAWSLVFVLLVVMVVDAIRGFPWLRALRDKLRSLRPRPRRASTPRPIVVHPKAADQLDAEIQKFFADEDKDRDPPEAAGV